MRKTTPLKLLLIKNGVSVPEFAEIMGYSVSNTYEIVSGRRQLRADEIVIICNAFDISADELLGIKEEEQC